MEKHKRNLNYKSVPNPFLLHIRDNNTNKTVPWNYSLVDLIISTFKFIESKIRYLYAPTGVNETIARSQIAMRYDLTIVQENESFDDVEDEARNKHVVEL